MNRGLIGAAMVLALAACSPQPTSTPSPAVGFDAWIQQAHDVDPGGPQEEALVAAQAQGAMAYEVIDELKDRMLECFAEAGLQYEDRSPREAAPGLVVVDYVFFTEQGAEGDRQYLEAQACEAKYLIYADEAYQSQQIAVDAWDVQRELERPLIVECLVERGVTVPENATYDDLITLSINQQSEAESAGIDQVPCPVIASQAIGG